MESNIHIPTGDLKHKMSDKVIVFMIGTIFMARLDARSDPSPDWVRVRVGDDL